MGFECDLCIIGCLEIQRLAIADIVCAGCKTGDLGTGDFGVLGVAFFAVFHGGIHTGDLTVRFADQRFIHTIDCGGSVLRGTSDRGCRFCLMAAFCQFVICGIFTAECQICDADSTDACVCAVESTGCRNGQVFIIQLAGQSYIAEIQYGFCSAVVRLILCGNAGNRDR